MMATVPSFRRLAAHQAARLPKLGEEAGDGRGDDRPGAAVVGREGELLERQLDRCFLSVRTGLIGAIKYLS